MHGDTYYFNSRSELESFLQSLNQRDIELNHWQIVHKENYTILAWKIIPSNCSISQVLSYAPCSCQQTDARFNITTNKTKVTLSSENFKDQITGELVEFEISSGLSDQPLDECLRLLDTVRFNGKSNPKLLHIIFCNSSLCNYDTLMKITLCMELPLSCS